MGGALNPRFGLQDVPGLIEAGRQAGRRRPWCGCPHPQEAEGGSGLANKLVGIYFTLFRMLVEGHIGVAAETRRVQVAGCGAVGAPRARLVERWMDDWVRWVTERPGRVPRLSLQLELLIPLILVCVCAWHRHVCVPVRLEAWRHDRFG
jgi:hypothetical protein